MIQEEFSFSKEGVSYDISSKRPPCRRIAIIRGHHCQAEVHAVARANMLHSHDTGSDAHDDMRTHAGEERERERERERGREGVNEPEGCEERRRRQV